ncbi:MAG: ATP-binding cassette domain-containing protein [Bacteroidales bacterium]|nr:ATP-binding cassette domain-containing protein [Bacteroidales bacterium]
MIEIKNIKKQYNLSKKQKKELLTDSDSIKAVDNVCFICKPGRVFSLLGPNGAGKTTLLRMIATILKPTSGNILVTGLDTIDDSKEVRKKIGFLTGSTNLYDRLTPGEIVKYFADLHGIEKKEFASRKEELFSRLGINEFNKKRIGQLSTGMKQKVSIARTMIHNPEVVIFDEPTSGLDVITADSIIELIRGLREQNKTVIFSSHIMSEVDLLCDDLAIISKGKLIYNDTMDAFRKETEGESLTSAFIKTVKKQYLN